MGKPPEPWCEAVLAGERVIDWDPAQGREWGDAAVRSVRAAVSAGEDRGSATSHPREQVRIITQPRGINYRGVVRCSKDAIVREAVATLTGARGQKVRRERKRDCSTMQDAFYNLCGAPFGLGRGTP